jgi:hypothetical protein
MTPTYWIKIALGMLVVFGIGMFAVKGVNAGKAKVMDITHSSSSITLPMLGASFKMNDAALGGLEKLQIARSAPDRIQAINLTVRLNDGVDVEQFADCELTVRDASHIDKNTGFTCLTAADPGFSDLVEFGRIKFLPSGQNHRLMLPRGFRDELQQGHTEALNSAGTDMAADKGDNGNVSVKINGKQVVDIQGNDAGGRILIRDPATGRAIVDISGNDAGGTVKIDGKVVGSGSATGN